MFIAEITIATESLCVGELCNYSFASGDNYSFCLAFDLYVQLPRFCCSRHCRPCNSVNCCYLKEKALASYPLSVGGSLINSSVRERRHFHEHLELQVAKIRVSVLICCALWQAIVNICQVHFLSSCLRSISHRISSFLVHFIMNLILETCCQLYNSLIKWEEWLYAAWWLPRIGERRYCAPTCCVHMYCRAGGSNYYSFKKFREQFLWWKILLH